MKQSAAITSTLSCEYTLLATHSGSCVLLSLRAAASVLTTVTVNILGCSGLSSGPVGKANEVPQSLECRVGGVRVEVEEEELCN